LAHLVEESEKGGESMNVKLRKRHRYLWMSLGIILPLLCLEAIEKIPTNALKDIPRHSCLLDIGVCGIDSDEFPIEISQTIDGNAIEVIVTSPLKSAFTIAYLSNQQAYDDSAIPLGAIHSMGDYTFNWSGEEKQYLLLYDKLNKATIYHQKLEVKP